MKLWLTHHQISNFTYGVLSGKNGWIKNEAKGYNLSEFKRRVAGAFLFEVYIASSGRPYIHGHTSRDIMPFISDFVRSLKLNRGTNLVYLLRHYIEDTEFRNFLNTTISDLKIISDIPMQADTKVEALPDVSQMRYIFGLLFKALFELHRYQMSTWDISKVKRGMTAVLQDLHIKRSGGKYYCFSFDTEVPTKFDDSVCDLSDVGVIGVVGHTMQIDTMLFNFVVLRSLSPECYADVLESVKKLVADFYFGHNIISSYNSCLTQALYEFMEFDVASDEG